MLYSHQIVGLIGHNRVIPSNINQIWKPAPHPLRFVCCTPMMTTSHSFMTLPPEICNRYWDSSDQATFFWCSVVQITLWAHTTRNPSFLFLLILTAVVHLLQGLRCCGFRNSCITWIFVLLLPSCQLEAVWPFSSDLDFLSFTPFSVKPRDICLRKSQQMASF